MIVKKRLQLYIIFRKTNPKLGDMNDTLSISPLSQLTEDEQMLKDHEGNFSEYWRRKKVAQENQVTAKKERPQKKIQANPAEGTEKKAPRPSYAQTKAQEDIEQKLEILEEEKEQVEAALTSAYETNEHDRGDELSQELRALEQQIEELYAQWEKVI